MNGYCCKRHKLLMTMPGYMLLKRLLDALRS
jgi:hypothetical protein